MSGFGMSAGFSQNLRRFAFDYVAGFRWSYCEEFNPARPGDGSFQRGHPSGSSCCLAAYGRAANPPQKPIPKSLINSDHLPERQVYHA
jgi:hypothetical protein